MLPLGAREAVEFLLTLADSVLAVFVTLHVLANRTDVRAGAGWMGVGLPTRCQVLGEAADMGFEG
jgi:hypothetical protein